VNAKPIELLVSRVRSGDPDNIEAQAAQKYLPAMLGSGFKRDRDCIGLNSFLNYGYTVLRAATARSIVAAGLHPSLGLHHKSNGSALRLADDLMEPFRPVVDLVAREMVEENCSTLEPENKRRLAAVLHADFRTSEGVSPLSTVMTRLAQSLAQVFQKERRALTFPISALPLTVSETAATGEMEPAE
jgi:CRISPR-associated protein Cas1